MTNPTVTARPVPWLAPRRSGGLRPGHVVAAVLACAAMALAAGWWNYPTRANIRALNRIETPAGTVGQQRDVVSSGNLLCLDSCITTDRPFLPVEGLRLQDAVGAWSAALEGAGYDLHSAGMVCSLEEAAGSVSCYVSGWLDDRSTSVSLTGSRQAPVTGRWTAGASVPLMQLPDATVTSIVVRTHP